MLVVLRQMSDKPRGSAAVAVPDNVTVFVVAPVDVNESVAE